jgi:hypothetical protein
MYINNQYISFLFDNVVLEQTTATNGQGGIFKIDDALALTIQNSIIQDSDAGTSMLLYSTS